MVREGHVEAMDGPANVVDVDPMTVLHISSRGRIRASSANIAGTWLSRMRGDVYDLDVKDGHHTMRCDTEYQLWWPRTKSHSVHL